MYSHSRIPCKFWFIKLQGSLINNAWKRDVQTDPTKLSQHSLISVHCKCLQTCLKACWAVMLVWGFGEILDVCIYLCMCLLWFIQYSYYFMDPKKANVIIQGTEHRIIQDHRDAWGWDVTPILVCEATIKKSFWKSSWNDEPLHLLIYKNITLFPLCLLNVIFFFLHSGQIGKKWNNINDWWLFPCPLSFFMLSVFVHVTNKRALWVK